MTAVLENFCTLCQAPLTQSLSYKNLEDQPFCCAGCQMVHQILKSKNALQDAQNHPLYQQALLSGLITKSFTPLPFDSQIIHENQKFALVIQEMWCPSCAQLITLLLSKEKGIYQCTVDYATDLALIEYAPRHLSKEKIISLIKKLGYTPYFLEDPRHQALSRTLLLRFMVAAFFSSNVMMFAYPLYAAYFEGDPEGYNSLFVGLSFAGSLPVLTYSAWPIWRRCWNGLKIGLWGMELLVCLATAAATGLSLYEMAYGSSLVYFDSMTVLILFVLLGKILESRAKFSAKDALVKLSWALPRRGRKKTKEGEIFVPIKEFIRGDLLVTKMGEKIVLDGQVVEGEGSCDESLMTGEVKPIVKTKTDLVLAGSYLQKGHLVIKVTATLEESALQKIIQMVEQGVKNKSQDKKFLDSLISYFIPFVVFLALVTGLICLLFSLTDGDKTVIQTALTRAVALLLISCPCAIGIAVPLAEAQVLNALAKKGMMVRNRAALQFIGLETQFVFDKTGTVTEGKFSLRAGLSELNQQEQIELKSIAHLSSHPIACAVTQAIDHEVIELDFWEEKIGKGICAQKGENTFILGSASFLKEKRIFLPLLSSSVQNGIETAVYFSKNGFCLTTLRLGDQLRKGVQEFIQTLKPINCLLVSGDAPEVTKQVAHLCQLNQWMSNYSPFQKKELVDQLKQKGEIVVMLGDGINDAPALTASHLSITTISAAETSIEISDILLTTSNFQALIDLRAIVLKSQKIIKQNLFWAFFYNGIGMALAMGGYLSPLFAACAMVFSSLIILFNSQRLANSPKS